jgi:FkbM family methyltransferase
MIGSRQIRSIFSTRFINTVKHSIGLNVDPDFEFERISKLGRYNPGSTNLVSTNFRFVDSESFINQYIDIFEKDTLHFKTDKDDPLIIDCGANIGMSITYFKRLYPKSKIIGFEPDPKIFETLKKNLNCFQGKNLELHEKAVWHKESTLPFTPDNADGGTIDKDGSITVNTVNINEFLLEEVDFLKIDIEGAEHEVLPAISNNLRNVKFLFLELHLDQAVPRQIEEILKLLRENSFVYSFNSLKNIDFDLLQNSLKNGRFIQQLNIFAVNENS